MNASTTFDRLRPDDEYLDDAAAERIWHEIVGVSGDRTKDIDEIEHGWSEPLVVVRAKHERPSRRRFTLVGTITAVLLGLGGFAAIQSTRHPASTVPSTAGDEPSQSTNARASNMLLLPPASNNGMVTYVQRMPPLPGRTRAIVQADDGSQIAIDLTEDYWGTLLSSMERRTIAGNDIGVDLKDSHRSYVVVAPCAMLAVGDGDNSAIWRSEIVSLFQATAIDNATTAITLPSGWSVVRAGPIGEWFSMQYTQAIDGTNRVVSLTQMPGSNAVSFLADNGGLDFQPINFRGAPGWKVEADGVTQIIWEQNNSAYTISAQSTTVDQLADVVGGLVPQSVDEWNSRFGDRDSHDQLGIGEPVTPASNVQCAVPRLVLETR